MNYILQDDIGDVLVVRLPGLPISSNNVSAHVQNLEQIVAHFNDDPMFVGASKCEIPT